MFVDELWITDHFLRRWCERVVDMDIPKRMDDDEFLDYLRGEGFRVAELKSSIAKAIGTAPYSGAFYWTPWVIVTQKGNAVTVRDGKL